tara:strand:- start:332 stop:502 length:171 start_codon:yes stop_codon:yes gene_type:complete
LEELSAMERIYTNNPLKNNNNRFTRTKDSPRVIPKIPEDPSINKEVSGRLAKGANS